MRESERERVGLCERATDRPKRMRERERDTHIHAHTLEYEREIWR